MSDSDLVPINRTIVLKSMQLKNLPTKFAWLSEDHDKDVSQYIEYNFDTEVYKERLRLYLSKYRVVKNEKKRRMYIVMIHQMYLELLEYILMLVKSLEYPISYLPVLMSSVFPKDIRSFARSYLENTSTDSDAETINVKSPIIPIAQRVAGWFAVDEAGKENLTAALFITIKNCMSDYLDPYYENIYNSMKHGNRGMGMGESSFKIYTEKDGEEIFGLQSSYSYRHPYLRRFKETKLNGLQPCVIERVLSIFDPEQIIARTDAVISLCDVIHYYYKSQSMGSKSRNMKIYLLDEVQDAWSDISKNGHTIDNFVSQITFNHDDHSAEATISIGIRFRTFERLNLSAQG
ncbi:hypothetical protein HLB42_12030 [Deinococcus sp. D7000]|nr:hypothetical protein HLB42_12030 [Deinococcus sp. D7000]